MLVLPSRFFCLVVAAAKVAMAAQRGSDEAQVRSGAWDSPGQGAWVPTAHCMVSTRQGPSLASVFLSV